MSEYQYYEFVAVDGPISDEGLRYARGCSSRAEVSRFRWRNVYHFGDFHGNEETLLKHYDAHFYIANWGTVRLGLAFPAASLPQEAVPPYLRGGERREDTLTLRKVGDRCIVWWERNEEGGWGWTEGEGGIDELIGVREEILRGDYRALFLGWLADFSADEWTNPKDKGVLLPPIPGGLDRLSAAQTALVKHFPVDRDALAVAARILDFPNLLRMSQVSCGGFTIKDSTERGVEIGVQTAKARCTNMGAGAGLRSRLASLSQASIPERLPAATVVQGLSVSEMRALLERVAEGEGLRVMAELNRLATPPPAAAGASTLCCVDFAAKVRAVRDARLKEEAKAEAAKRKRDAEARRQRLASVMERADTIWAGLDPLMDQKVTAAYEQVAAQLKELRDAHEQAGENAKFQQKLATFRERYARRSAMMRRIEEL